MDIDNLRQRFQTTLLILPIFVLPIYLGGFFFKIILICISLVLFYELLEIINFPQKKIATSVYLFFLCLSVFIFTILPSAALIICLVILILGSILIKLSNRGSSWLIAITNYCYLTFLLFYQIRMQDNITDGLNSIFLIITIAVISDTSGYFGGQLFGGKKIFPNLSPNKTVQGTLFALIMPSIFIFFLVQVFGVGFHSSLLLLFILIMSLGAILGDLSGSYLKRNFNVSNSSNFLPGHGGLLDRMDSIIGVGIFFLIIESIIVNTIYENILYFWR